MDKEINKWIYAELQYNFPENLEESSEQIVQVTSQFLPGLFLKK